ncbi:MAG TPA: GntR family transcriptional regulator [Alphaproteobacteria bacterium]|nr:GntR family transcriptional regulator [Alphaproteobacteria bacterium]
MTGETTEPPEMRQSLDPRAPVLRAAQASPLYEQVKRQISELILVGAWPPGSVLPGEVALAQQFGVAVGTVRRALADLTAEGLLTRRRKTGTVVTGRTPHHSLRFFFQYFRLHGLDGQLLRSETEVIKRELRPPTVQEAADLRVSGHATVVELERLRRVAGRAVMREALVLPTERVPDLAHEDAPPLFYLHLLERFGIRISAVREQLSAAIADDDDRRLLDLDGGSAVLVIDEIAYDQTGEPIISARHRATTDRYRYVNEIR